MATTTTYRMFGTLYSGSEFTALLKKHNVEPLKVLRKDFTHNGYTFINGLNIDTHNIHADETHCSPNGIYFTWSIDVLNWLNYKKELHWIVPVKVPDDATVILFAGKAKADKIILELDKAIAISDYISSENLEDEAIRCNPSSISHIIQPTDKEMCYFIDQYNENMSAKIMYKKILEQCRTPVTPLPVILHLLTRFGLALEFITEQTEEMCLIAVKSNGWALQYVEKQTDKICLAAVKQNGCALKFVIKQTYDICIAAVTQTGYASQYVDELHFPTIKLYADIWIKKNR